MTWLIYSVGLVWSASLRLELTVACKMLLSVCFFPLVFVFKPSEPRPLYIQKSICREEVKWGVFVPRDVPESFTSEAHQWLNRSQFYFLTKSQVTILPQRKQSLCICNCELLWYLRVIAHDRWNSFTKGLLSKINCLMCSVQQYYVCVCVCVWASV